MLAAVKQFLVVKIDGIPDKSIWRISIPAGQQRGWQNPSSVVISHQDNIISPWLLPPYIAKKYILKSLSTTLRPCFHRAPV